MLACFTPLHQLFVVLLVDIIVAIELCKLGFDLGHHTDRRFQPLVARLIFGYPRLQRRDSRLGLGEGNPQLLVHGVRGDRRRRVGQRRLAPGNDLLSASALPAP
jgi:hypothetical protein